MLVLEDFFHKYIPDFSYNHFISFLLLGFGIGYFFIKSIKVLFFFIIVFIIVSLYYHYSFSDLQISSIGSLFSYMQQFVTGIFKEYLQSISVLEIIAIIIGFLLGIKFG